MHESEEIYQISTTSRSNDLVTSNANHETDTKCNTKKETAKEAHICFSFSLFITLSCVEAIELVHSFCRTD